MILILILAVSLALRGSSAASCSEHSSPPNGFPFTLPLHLRVSLTVGVCPLLAILRSPSPLFLPPDTRLEHSPQLCSCATLASPLATSLHNSNMSRIQQDQFVDDEEEECCPLCVEEFDLSDRNFRPCPCGYQVCHRVQARFICTAGGADSISRYVNFATTTSRRP